MCVQQQAQQQKQRQAQQQEQQHQKNAEQQYQEGAEQQHQKPTAPDSKEEEDEDGEVTQIFVNTDEGRTSALQVTSIDTIGEIVRGACGLSSTRGAGTCNVKGGCSGVRTPQEVAEWRMETCCSLTRRMCGGGGNKNRKRSAKKESTGRRVDQEKEKVLSELNEARITRMLRERSEDDVERLIKASVNWSKESLGVSDEIEEGIRNMLERFQRERPAEEGDRRKGPQKGRGFAMFVQWGLDGHHELDETRGKGKGKGVEAKESTREEETIEAEEKERTCQAPTTKTGKKGADG